MRWTGSKIERTMDGAKIRIKNRLGMWVIIPTQHPDSLRYCEYFMDKAGQVICQNPLGGKRIVRPPYIIECTIQGQQVKTTFPFPDRATPIES